MSDEQEKDDQEYYEVLRKHFEEHISLRPLTAEEFAQLRAVWASPQCQAMRYLYDPKAHVQAHVNFMRKLMNRQGTKTPNFEELYRRKDALDEKLRGDEEDSK